MDSNSFDGKTLAFKPNNIKQISAQVQFEFSFLQFLSDKNPKEKLAFTKSSKWVNLPIVNNEIKLADYSEKSNHPSVQSLFNLSKVDLIYWIIIEDFELLKSISLDAQRKFFSDIMDNQKEYQSCCFEDIKRGGEFLLKERSEFNSIIDLGVEMYVKKRSIHLKGIYNDGEKFQMTIIQQ